MANKITTAARAKRAAKAAAAPPAPAAIRPAERPAATRVVMPTEPYRPFPVECLPGPIRRFVAEMSAALRCDPAFLALPCLGVAGGLIANARRIRLEPTWTEPAIIWTVVVSDPSTKKSPAFEHVMTPVYEMHELSSQALNSRVPSDIYIEDITLETVYQVMAQNQRGTLYALDEISTFYSNFCKYQKNGVNNCSEWLRFWSPFTKKYQRKTGEVRNLFFRGACLSITGGVQPGVIASLFAGETLFYAGAPFRFLYAMPPLRTDRWKKKAESDEEARQQSAAVRSAAEAARGWKAVCERLVLLAGQQTYPISSEAEELWREFYDRNNEAQETDRSIMMAAYGKVRAYAARLALLHAVVGAADGEEPVEVGAESMSAGIRLAEWFLHEASRVVSIRSESTERRDIRYLADWIANRGGRISARELMVAMRRRFATADAAMAALESLQSCGYGTLEKEGRQKLVFVCRQTPPTATTPQAAADEPPAAVPVAEDLAADEVEETPGDAEPVEVPTLAIVPEPEEVPTIAAHWNDAPLTDVEKLNFMLINRLQGQKVKTVGQVRAIVQPGESLILALMGGFNIALGTPQTYGKAVEAIVRFLRQSQPGMSVCRRCAATSVESPALEWSGRSLCALCAAAEESVSKVEPTKRKAASS